MRLFHFISLFFFATSPLLADSLKDLYDPSQQINRNKTSTLAQQKFKTSNFAFNQSALSFQKSLSLNQTAKSKRLTWNQTSSLANRKYEKASPASMWSKHASSMSLFSYNEQNKSFDTKKPYEAPSANLNFKNASGFSKNYPVQEYRGDLPINVSKSLQSKKEKALTIEEIKEILNKNK